MTETDQREARPPYAGIDPGSNGATGTVPERPEKVARRVPWSILELWLGAALPGAIFAILAFVISVATDVLGWPEAEVEGATPIAVGPLLLLAAWVLLIRRRGLTRRHLGLRAFKPSGGLIVPMLLVVDFIFAFAYLGLLDMYGALPSASTSRQLPVSVVATVLFAPVCEELFFRALLFTGFRHYYGPRRAAVFSAALFALYHLNPLFFVSHFISGIALAALLDATGSIWPSILLHAAWNTWIEMGEAGFWIVVLIAFLITAIVAMSPLWFAAHRFWQRIGQKEPPSPSLPMGGSMPSKTESSESSSVLPRNTAPPL